MSYYRALQPRKHPVWSLARIFVDISLHRRGPEHVPSSQFFFVLVLVVSSCISIAALLFVQSFTRSLVVTVITTVIDFAFFWVVLKSFSRERRFVQTMTALLGTSAFLNLLVMPLQYWGKAVGGVESDTALPWLLLFMISIWWIDVGGFVLARAVDRPYVLGVAIMLGYVMLSLSLEATFFPEGAA